MIGHKRIPSREGGVERVVEKISVRLCVEQKESERQRRIWRSRNGEMKIKQQRYGGS